MPENQNLIPMSLETMAAMGVDMVTEKSNSPTDGIPPANPIRRAMTSRCHGPTTCNFSDPARYRVGDHWMCATCGTLYVKKRAPRHFQSLRPWSAPDGYWDLPFFQRIKAILLGE